jgi:hypothetical protein
METQQHKPAARAGAPAADSVEAELQRQPHILLRLAENSLTVATGLRDNYFRNTARFVSDVRRRVQASAQGDRLVRILHAEEISARWEDFHEEVVSFIDGGVGRVEISSQVPILLRVGSYTVKVGERRLAEREQFGYYPVILGDLQGGSKDRKDFVDIVRITAELLGGLSALARNPDMHVLLFHGPLVYVVWHYAGHTPFTEADIDLFLRQYAPADGSAACLKEEFLREARLHIYPLIVPERSDEWANRRVFEPLAWISFLYRKLIAEVRSRLRPPLIAGVVERGDSREFCEQVLLERIFRNLRANQRENHFNQLFNRTDLTSPAAVLKGLRYSDTLLLAMILRPGNRTESWRMAKYDGLRTVNVSLPGESFSTAVNFAALRSGPYGFPPVSGCYVHVSETTEPIRVEVFPELGDDQLPEAARRVYLYSRLLPGYGFPVGLDIVDKYAHVPAWLTSAYSKLLRYHLGVSLQRGEISDQEMRRILVQAIYMSHRDWIFRPQSGR